MTDYVSWIHSTLTLRSEAELHPHCEEERAHTFTSVDSGAPEIEVIEFLSSLVRMIKPTLVLETGTGSGLSSLALAASLRKNGFGHLHTVELDHGNLERAKRLAASFDPSILDWVTFYQTNSFDLINTWSQGAFDLAFFDTDIAIRHFEFDRLHARGLLAPRAVAVFHDTSRLRGKTLADYNPQAITALDQLSRGLENLEFGLSRGLRLLRLP